MARHKRKRDTHRAGRAPAARAASAKLGPDRPVAALAALGLLLTGYLTVAAWTRIDPAGCMPGAGCEVIHSSAWSILLGMPMALWGFATYAVIGALALMARTTPVRRWRHLWRVSLLGLAVSVYLTAVGVLVLDALCAFCLLSLATMAAIFVMVHLRRPAAAPGTRWSSWLLGNLLVAMAVVAVLQVHLAGMPVQRPEDPRLVALLAHLEGKGTRYYGTSWCVECRKQKKIFGASAARLPYVECSTTGAPGAPQTFECARAGIESYPTWVIDGLQHRQVMQPRELAAITGFDWSGYKAQ